MSVKAVIDINDALTPKDAAQLQAFLLKLDPVITKPTVEHRSGTVRVRIRWVTTQGTVVEAAAMWYPMLLGCWIHLDRDLRPADIDQARFFWET